MAYPIPQVDIDLMLSDREIHMSIPDQMTNSNIILFNSTRIKVEELISYFYLNNDNQLTGIRFWPAIMDYSLVFPMISVSTSSADAKAFCLLEEPSYLDPGNNFSKIVSRPLAMRCFAEYKSNVLIDGQNQADIVAIDSRFMKWEDIIALLTANIPGFVETDPSTFDGYSIKIEQGYTSSEMAEKFYSEYGIGTNNTDYIGYTVILSVFDRAGVQLINPNANYVEGDYSGRYLEAVKPCPPTCV
jgi:hypothetical protein